MHGMFMLASLLPSCSAKLLTSPSSHKSNYSAHAVFISHGLTTAARPLKVAGSIWKAAAAADVQTLGRHMCGQAQCYSS